MPVTTCMFEGARNQMVGHSISKTRGNVVETGKMMTMTGEGVRDDDSTTIDIVLDRW